MERQMRMEALNRKILLWIGFFLATTLWIGATAHRVDARPVQNESGGTANPVDDALSVGRYETLIASITIFVLAVFVGFEVITKVPPTLHTPLMSGSNAVSGITLVGALLAAGSQQFGLSAMLGFVAVTLATINVVGGFLVTHRMLSMFQKKS